MKLNRTQGALLAIAGLVQALLTAAGASNGGLSALVINEKPAALTAGGAIFAAILIAAILAAGGANRRAKRLGVLAVVLFIGGMGVTAYAAAVAPNKQSQPEISATLHAGSPLVLDGTVKASGVKRSVTLNVYVDGLYERAGGYDFTDPTLYQAHIGADASGNVKHSFSILIPTKTYDAIAINAWAGASSFCPPPTGRSASSPGHKACVFIRLVNVGGRESAAPVTRPSSSGAPPASATPFSSRAKEGAPERPSP